MKKRLGYFLYCFNLTFFIYFRYLLGISILLLIGSIFFRPLFYAGILILLLDVLFSLGITCEMTFTIQRPKKRYLFEQMWMTDYSDPSERNDDFDFEYHDND